MVKGAITSVADVFEERMKDEFERSKVGDPEAKDHMYCIRGSTGDTSDTIDTLDECDTLEDGSVIRTTGGAPDRARTIKKALEDFAPFAYERRKT
jgi:hypothetical protein